MLCILTAGVISLSSSLELDDGEISELTHQFESVYPLPEKSDNPILKKIADVFIWIGGVAGAVAVNLGMIALARKLCKRKEYSTEEETVGLDVSIDSGEDPVCNSMYKPVELTAEMLTAEVEPSK
jgi:hypothetical protein